MSGLLDGKAALVTGGARGIGRAAALAFAREGASVVVADLLVEEAKETVALIEAAGGNATAVYGDVTSAEMVRDWVSQVQRSYGRVDCAFNNAGIASGSVGAAFKLLAEWPEDAFERMIEVNLKSVWLCMRDEINAMLADGKGGAIVNTSSIGGLVGVRTGGAYGAAKAGVVGLTKIAAVEYAERGIRVNAIAPGMIDTDMMRSRLDDNADAQTALIPAKRIGSVNDVAELVVWLCSDRADYVTGQTIAVDGGYVAQ